MNRWPAALLLWLGPAIAMAQEALPEMTVQPVASVAQTSSVRPSPAVPPIDDPLLHSRGTWGQDFEDQWALYRINAVAPGGVVLPHWPEVLDPVVVALIDTGIDYDHPDLPIEHLWRNPDERANGRDDDGNGLIDDLIGWNFVDDNNQPWDDHGHGTLVAGVIAAGRDNGRGISGLAPNARLMVLKALDVSGHGNGSQIARAIRYAVDKGARLIHLSIGGEAPGVQELDALDYALSREVLVVTAAGNRASDDSSQGYEQRDGVLLVGAVTPDGERAGFSDWGPGLDLMAPGVEILSLRARGSDFLRLSGPPDYPAGSAVVDRDYYRATGNSFAAPHVTALAALILGRDPWLEPTQLERMLTQSARDLGPPGRDQAHGYGVIDVAAALEVDPDRYLESRLTRAELDGNRQLVVYGSADADRFYQARLEYGTGQTPSDWHPLLPRPVTVPVHDQALVHLDLNLLPAGELLTLRLVAEHLDGGTRESRLQLQLPAGGAR